MLNKNLNEVDPMVKLNMDAEAVGVALAAGLGTRLRPLTESRPKPLVPFCGVEILSIVINKLKKTGISNVGVNTHYLYQKVNNFITAQNYDPVFVSFEKKQILQNLKDNEFKLSNEIRELDLNNHLLSDNLDLDYIETLIRERFLFGKEGETIYIIKKDEN
mgnify:CR=1 FL=1